MALQSASQYNHNWDNSNSKEWCSLQHLTVAVTHKTKQMQPVRIPARSKSSYLNPGRYMRTVCFSIWIFIFIALTLTKHYTNRLQTMHSKGTVYLLLYGKAGMVFLLQVTLCDPCLSASKWFVYYARCYTSALLLLLYFLSVPISLTVSIYR